MLSFQEKINKKYPEENLEVLLYTHAKGPAKIRCNTCQKVYTYKQGGNAIAKQKKILCHDCVGNKKKYKSYIQAINDKFPNDNLEIVLFTKREEPCIIKCKTCGKIFEYKQGNYALRKQRNYFCNKCFPFKNDIMEKKRLYFKQFITNSQQWELAQSIDNVHSADLVECKCLKCGKISSKTIADYLRGRGCIYCCGNKQRTSEDFKQELDPGYVLLSEYKNANSKVLLEHSCGLKYYVTPHNYLNGKRCPACSRKQSKGEHKIEQYLLKHNIDYEKEFPVVIDRHLLRLDFYLLDLDLYIEFQGIQHYEPVDFFGGEKRLQKQQEYDLLKKQLLNDKLIIISYEQINEIPNILDQALKFND